MKKLSTLDIIVRIAVIAILAGVSVTGYLYHIGQFGH